MGRFVSMQNNKCFKCGGSEFAGGMNGSMKYPLYQIEWYKREAACEDLKRHSRNKRCYTILHIQ